MLCPSPEQSVFLAPTGVRWQDESWYGGDQEDLLQAQGNFALEEHRQGYQLQQMLLLATNND